jgi:hypothetical protein
VEGPRGVAADSPAPPFLAGARPELSSPDVAGTSGLLLLKFQLNGYSLLVHFVCVLLLYVAVSPAVDEREDPEAKDHGAEDTAYHDPGKGAATFGADTVGQGCGQETDGGHHGGHNHGAYLGVDAELYR